MAPDNTPFLVGKGIAFTMTGGIDSTACLFWMMEHLRQRKIFPPNIHLLLADFGQACSSNQVAIIERLMRHNISYPGKIHLHVLDCPLPQGSNEAHATACYTPKAQEETTYEDGVQSHQMELIDGRNVLLFTHMIAWCCQNSVPVLYTGHQLESGEWENLDSYRHRQEDFGPYFLDRFNIMQEVGFRQRVRVVAPFIDLMWNKYEIAKWLRGRWELKNTYSCNYYPECGTCDNCINRRNVLAALDA